MEEHIWHAWGNSAANLQLHQQYCQPYLEQQRQAVPSSFSKDQNAFQNQYPDKPGDPNGLQQGYTASIPAYMEQYHLQAPPSNDQMQTHPVLPPQNVGAYMPDSNPHVKPPGGRYMPAAFYTEQDYKQFNDVEHDQRDAQPIQQLQFQPSSEVPEAQNLYNMQPVQDNSRNSVQFPPNPPQIFALPPVLPPPAQNFQPEQFKTAQPISQLYINTPTDPQAVEIKAQFWICSQCTFENHFSKDQCQMWEFQRTRWTCQKCTFENEPLSQTVCQACGQSRGFTEQQTVEETKTDEWQCEYCPCLNPIDTKIWQAWGRTQGMGQTATKEWECRRCESSNLLSEEICWNCNCTEEVWICPSCRMINPLFAADCEQCRQSALWKVCYSRQHVDKEGNLSCQNWEINRQMQSRRASTQICNKCRVMLVNGKCQNCSKPSLTFWQKAVNLVLPSFLERQPVCITCRQNRATQHSDQWFVWVRKTGIIIRAAFCSSCSSHIHSNQAKCATCGHPISTCPHCKKPFAVLSRSDIACQTCMVKKTRSKFY